MDDTLALWESLIAGEYEVVLSEVTTSELEGCEEPKLSVLADYLNKVSFKVLPLNDDVINLANEIIDRGILTAKNLNDCRHIAAAILDGCDIIVSWNFRHLVNVRTIDGVREIIVSKRYKPIDIYSPNMLLKGDD